MAKIPKYTPQTRMLKALRMSAKIKIKSGWSRDIGAGFIAVDIQNMQLLDKVNTPSYQIRFTFTWGNQDIPIADLNLRETEEAIKWLELRISEPNDKYFKEKLEAAYNQ